MKSRVARGDEHRSAGDGDAGRTDGAAAGGDPVDGFHFLSGVVNRLDANAPERSPASPGKEAALSALRQRYQSRALRIFLARSADRTAQNSDYGGHHLALYVDDFHRALAYLKEKKVPILGEPTVRTEGPNAGVTWIYFLTPWGMQMGLLSYRAGNGYESARPDRLWHPAFPER